MSVYVIKFEKDNLIIREWVLKGNEDLERSLIEMLDIDFKFINKIRGLSLIHISEPTRPY